MNRSLYPRMAAALLALLGLFDALYLALERLLPDTSLYCPTGGGCEVVQNSPYATLFGVPVAFIGVAGYAVLLGVALLALHGDVVAGIPLPALLLGLASVGGLFGLYLTYLQVAVIGAVCFWCAVSALLELGIWLAALVDWRRMRRMTPATARARRPAQR